MKEAIEYNLLKIFSNISAAFDDDTYQKVIYQNSIKNFLTSKYINKPQDEFT